METQMLLSEWKDKPLSEIVDFILKNYHERLHIMLPELILFAGKVEKVHGDHEFCPKGLEAKLQKIYDELQNHMLKEEQILFPLIKKKEEERFEIPMMPIMIMQEEHNMHRDDLKDIRAISFDFVAPEGACGTWRALYNGLTQLELELIEHINLENTVLFKRALES